MDGSFQRVQIGDGIWFNSVTDPKFKHNRVTANLLLPLDRATVTENALLPFLLRRGCRRFPDFTQLNRKLCDLYGASLSCDVTRFGAYQALDLSVTGIDDRFTLEGKKMAAECAQLLADVLLDPNLDGEGLFQQADVQLERQQLCDTIEGIINDKRQYAVNRCRAAMCEGEPFAIERYGYLEEAKELNRQAVTKAWRRALETARIELFFVGSGNPQEAQEIFSRAMGQLKGRKPVEIQRQTAPVLERPVKELVEEMEVAQSKLVLGMRTGGHPDAKQQMALRMMAALYGGTPNSKLFMNVREKMSLCYYCAARFDRLTGFMLVDSGVERQNREKAQAEILRQLDQLREGAFTEEEMTATRLLMQTSLRAVSDSLGTLEDWYMTQLMNGTCASPLEELEQLNQVTREELQQAANQVRLDTVYFLTGKGAQ